MIDGSIEGGAYVDGPGPSTGPGSIAILGGGRAGAALAREIEAAGLPFLGVWNRTERPPPEGLGARWRCGGATPPTELLRADVLLLAVLDGAIAQVAAGLRSPPGSVVLHLSGALGSEALVDLPVGVHRGCYHPLQSFGAVLDRAALAVPPYCVAIEGDDAAVAAARRLAAATGHPAVTIPTGGKAAYHAAAVLASNCLVALEATACRAMQHAGVSEADAWRLLWPLVAGTLANLEGGDFGAALTGPIPRGDADTVRRNLAAIADDVDAVDVYGSLGREAVQLARASGLQEEQAEAILEALGRLRSR